MYNMYPDYQSMMSERGEAGLGHPDGYLVDQQAQQAAMETMRPNPNFHAAQQRSAERALGFVSVAEMIDE